MSEADERVETASEEARFAELSMDMLGVASTRDGRWTRVNPAMSRILGWSAAELLATPYHEIVHPDDAAATRAALEQLADGVPLTRFENRVRCRDGSYRWIAWATGTDPEHGLIYCVGRDVTELKHTERALHQSEQLLRATLDNFPTVIAYKDREGRFLDVNHAVEAALGLPKEQIRGQTIDAFIPATTTAALRQRDLEVMESRRAIQFEEATSLPTGLRHHINTYFPLIDDDDQVYGTGHIAHDITIVREAEAALRALNEQLQDADRRKDEFIAVLSHELRNPLAPIRMSLHLLDGDPPPEQARRARAVIERQVQHMSRLVEDLLDVTRISRGKITLRRERIDLNVLAREEAEDARHLFAAAGSILQIEIGSGRLEVDADPTRLAQIIDNLLTNAAKFGARGGTTLLAIESSPTHATIRVRDDGVGMSPQTLAELFQPFVQAAQTIDRTRGGLGLGLALVRGLVEMHGGTVTATSAGEGQGAELIVVLPRPVPVPVRVVAGLAAASPPATWRILIVEDNVDAAETLRDILELRGHEVAVAYTGPAGVETADRFVPEILLCDLGLPGLDGFGVARALRADPRFAACLFIALSGYAGPDDVAQARAAGFDHHLAKPADLHAIYRVLATAPARAPT